MCRWQELVGGDAANVQASEEFTFQFDPNNYPANWFYSGSWRLEKHYYPNPGEMDASGEEFECAAEINRHVAVKTWVRNLSKQPTLSFWLQTATDRFYPDFVALLHDGRI